MNFPSFLYLLLNKCSDLQSRESNCGKQQVVRFLKTGLEGTSKNSLKPLKRAYIQKMGIEKVRLGSVDLETKKLAPISITSS